jgi:hypothetical protein
VGVEHQLIGKLPDIASKTTENVEEVVREIRGIGCGLVIIDGCRGAGKTHLMNELAGKLGCASIELDCLWDRAKPGYAAAMRFDELAINLAWSKSWSKIVLASGICIREIMKRLNEPVHFSVYVQRVSRMGISADCEALDAENVRPTSFPQHDLDDEVLLYHWDHKPKRNADIIYERLEAELIKEFQARSLAD